MPPHKTRGKNLLKDHRFKYMYVCIIYIYTLYTQKKMIILCFIKAPKMSFEGLKCPIEGIENSKEF